MSAIAADIAKEWAAAQGMGTIDNPLKFKGQDFAKLKAECLASGTLFEDPEFPAVQSSMGNDQLGPESDEGKGSVWKRPKDFCDDPVFTRAGASRDDIIQGGVCDCWFLASISSIAENKEFLRCIVPKGQKYRSEYAGIFCFKIWRYGNWYEVVVDDLLPTKNGKLVLSKTKTFEFWAVLFEKAYAKMVGCYEALMYGRAVETLTDLTGGVGEMILIKGDNVGLLERIRKTLDENSFVTASAGNNTAVKRPNCQVIINHVYSVTGLEEVDCDGKKVQLIRVRNPWGYREGKGPWSDDSAEWDKVDPKVKEKLLKKKDDGEFWMDYSDFLLDFYNIELCNLNLSQAYNGENLQWRFKQFNGRWTAGSNAGGKLDSELFWTNPKYKVHLQEPDTAGGEECTVVISLMQKGIRSKKPLGVSFFRVGFYIFEVSGDEELGKEFFKDKTPVGKVDLYWVMREQSGEFKLKPGKYVVIPTTKTANEESDYFLRIYSKKPFEVEEVGKEVKAEPFEPGASKDDDPEFKDLDETGEYNEDEVKKFLDKWLAANYKDLKWEGLSKDCVCTMIKLVDLDYTKTLSTQELKKLWQKVKNYMTIFTKVDVDKTGTIDAHELRNALKQAGFAVDDKGQELLVQRYINKDNLTLSVNGFLSCMMQLETLFNMFKILKTEDSKTISLSLEEWVRVGLA